jgi:aspartyl-tRNA(Asn)/glutamyl-tRNA(Gln) amidotransferase subunit B
VLQLSANYLVTDALSLRGSRSDEFHIMASQMLKILMEMLSRNEINSRIAKDLLPEVLFEGLDPNQAVSQRGLGQLSSTDSLLPVVDEVVAANPSVVEEYKSGKLAALQFLVGQGMKISRGSANPATLADLIKQRIG